MLEEDFPFAAHGATFSLPLGRKDALGAGPGLQAYRTAAGRCGETEDRMDAVDHDHTESLNVFFRYLSFRAN